MPQPSHPAILNALGAYACLRELGVPARRIFVCQRQGGLMLVAIPLHGAQLKLHAGIYDGAPLAEAWKSALAWCAQTASDAELHALYDQWLAAQSQTFLRGLIHDVQQRVWDHLPSDQMACA